MKLLSSEITSYNNYLNRRTFIKIVSASSLGFMAPNVLKANHEANIDQYANQLENNDILSKFEEITNYNNYYEFGTGKNDPAKYSQDFQTSPWKIKIEGLVKYPGDYYIEDILKGVTIEDRIYRLRCVEGWSMVIPWQGFP